MNMLFYRFATELQIPIVATNDVCFLSESDFEAHEARVCIHDGMLLEDSKRPRLYSESQYLKTPEDMIALFDDMPQAIQNSLLIAKRCSTSLDLGKNYLPNFPVPQSQSIDSFLTMRSEEGLEKRLSIILKRVR